MEKVHTVNLEESKQLAESIRIKCDELNALLHKAGQQNLFVDLETHYYQPLAQKVETRLARIKGIYYEI